MLTYGQHRALNEIEHILSSQWSNGLLPHIRFTPGQDYRPNADDWGVTEEISGNTVIRSSGITQPPNIALALQRVLQSLGDITPLQDRIASIYHKIDVYHQFLMDQHDPEHEGLIAVYHPWATGTDNAPCYDDLLLQVGKSLKEQGFINPFTRADTNKIPQNQRPSSKEYDAYGMIIDFMSSYRYDHLRIYHESPFVVQDVLVNTLFVGSCRAMVEIARQLESLDPNYYLQEQSRYEHTVKRFSDAIRTKLWCEEDACFYNYDVRDDDFLRVRTISGLTPLFGTIATQNQAEQMIQDIQDPQKFGTDLLLPSTAHNSSFFDPHRYWKGPIWPVTNWIIYQGLKCYDGELAAKLRGHTIQMIEEGFGDKVDVQSLAVSLMEYTSHGEAFTTPSRSQYMNGWLWDSGFAAIGWAHVPEKITNSIWQDISAHRAQMREQGVELEKHRSRLQETYQIPMFDEYYCPIHTDIHIPGDPLGAQMMTWTAAVYLDLMNDSLYCQVI